jgi:riboflavin kinase/FMN adenylyltransferase
LSSKEPTLYGGVPNPDPMPVPPAIPAAFTVVRDGDAMPPKLRRAIVAIGNFDGVHRGHRAVLDAAVTTAAEERVPAIALTFEPHPRKYFRPNDALFRLTPEAAKLRLLADAGLAGAGVLNFDAKLATLTAESFVKEILVRWLAMSGVVVGEDFHFGRRRQGTPDFLKEQGTEHWFSVQLVKPVLVRGKPVSSGMVRAALEEGRVREAAKLLGHSWFVEGEVERGAQRGRELGFPTANISLDPACGLKHGIYAVRAYLGEQGHDAVASFGRRPQFDDGAPLLEVYLFDFSGELYAQSLTVEFVDFIRPEAKFESVDALVAEMKRDVEKARAILIQE